jgi:hypothetical protein
MRAVELGVDPEVDAFKKALHLGPPHRLLAELP